MTLDIGIYLLLIIFTPLPKCHSWMKDYMHNSAFETSDLFQLPEYLHLHCISELCSLCLGIKSASAHENSLLFKTIIENQIRAQHIISDIESNIPPLTQNSKDSISKNIIPKEVYFVDYPHTKALLKLQWRRLENSLLSHTLGSLRIHSPFYRP